MDKYEQKAIDLIEGTERDAYAIDRCYKQVIAQALRESAAEAMAEAFEECADDISPAAPSAFWRKKAKALRASSSVKEKKL